MFHLNHVRPFRGDWKWLRESWNMKRWWKYKRGICFKCLASSSPGPYALLDQLCLLFLIPKVFWWDGGTALCDIKRSQTSQDSTSLTTSAPLLGSAQLGLSMRHCPLDGDHVFPVLGAYMCVFLRTDPEHV